ncbi:hypothetical protein SDC9_138713 [bioreactor metagenome]|uniref:Uncharacterized protein n=1 Tax=bioreactor metagenome TaxID=1076179 RepID=A0A645DT06_9ZZZZ
MLHPHHLCRNKGSFFTGKRTADFSHLMLATVANGVVRMVVNRLRLDIPTKGVVSFLVVEFSYNSIRNLLLALFFCMLRI